jgi:putative acetyltransferase
MHTSNLAIRPFSDSDAEAVLNVHYSAIHGCASSDYDADTLNEWAPPVDPMRVDGLLREKVADGMTMLVATEVDDVVGFASIVPSRSTLRAVYIASRFQRRGIGKKLLAAAEEFAKQQGVSTLHLNSSLNAVAFYRACGYEKVGDGVHRLRSGRQMACIQMSKRL